MSNIFYMSDIRAKEKRLRRGSRFMRTQIRLGAAEVGAFAGVDADLLAFVDEGRHLDDEAGFRLGGLGDARRSRGLEAGLRLDDREFHKRGQLDADCVAVVV